MPVHGSFGECPILHERKQAKRSNMLERTVDGYFLGEAVDRNDGKDKKEDAEKKKEQFHAGSIAKDGDG